MTHPPRDLINADTTCCPVRYLIDAPMNDLPLNERIYEIAIAAQNTLPNSPARRQLITELLQTLEQWPNLVKPRQRDSFIACYNVAKQTVHADLFKHIEQRRFTKQDICQKLTIELTDPYLKELVLSAQNTPPNTVQRSIHINELLRVIDRSGRLPFRASQLTMTNDEIRAEAKQRLYQYIYKNIGAYDPGRAPVMGWISYILQKRYYLEAINNLWNYRPRGMDADTQILSLDQLDNVWPIQDKRNQPSKTELLRQLIDDDVDGTYKKEHIKDHPEANFRFIALKRIDGFKWQEISAELARIPIPTLNAFYLRCLRKFAPDFRDHLID